MASVKVLLTADLKHVAPKGLQLPSAMPRVVLVGYVIVDLLRDRFSIDKASGDCKIYCNVPVAEGPWSLQLRLITM